MRTLIIPDVHGRDFWKNPIKEQWDKIVFLGDYTDPYPGEAPQSEVLTNIIDIVEFRDKYPDKVILLWGNHDLPYWCENYRKNLSYWCRHDTLRHDDIEAYFNENLDKFQWAYQQDNILFTHAGINNGFAKLLGEEYGQVNADTINNFFNDEKNQMLLAMVSWYRGGPDRYGSPVWADVHEHLKTPNKYIKDLFQIFGHTYSKKQIITKNWAMLDVGGEYAYLDDEGLMSQYDIKLEITKL